MTLQNNPSKTNMTSIVFVVAKNSTGTYKYVYYYKSNYKLNIFILLK